MELGYFTMPSHPPERPLRDGHEWDLQVIRWLDELGYKECWIGEHHTAPWEPHPSPDLLVAQALMQTKNIRLGPGGFLLPYHHPAELANRVAMLDHISGGRLNFGVAASGLPSDWAMFNVDGATGANREMTREALDIILKMWSTNEPFEYVGKYWTVKNPELMYGFLKPHIKPMQKPLPPIGVAGLSQGLRHAEARRRARLYPDEPQSQSGLCREPLGSRSRSAPPRPAARRTAAIGAWCARCSSPTPTRKPMRLSVGLAHGPHDARVLPAAAGRVRASCEYLKHDPNVADSDVTPEYCAKHNWIIGSPATVAEKIAKIYRRGRRLRPAAGVRLRLCREPARPGSTRSSCWRRRCCRGSSTYRRELIAPNKNPPGAPGGFSLMGMQRSDLRTCS